MSKGLKRNLLSLRMRIILPMVVYGLVLAAIVGATGYVRTKRIHSEYWNEEAQAVTLDLDHLNQTLLRELLLGIAVVLVALAAVLLLSYSHLKVLIFDPLSAISDTLFRRGRGDNHAFVPKLSDNEIGFLARTLNELLAWEESIKRELEDKQKQVALAAKASKLGMWDWNLKTDTLHWDKQLLELMGIKEEEFNPHFSEFTDRLHPDDKASVLKSLEEHLGGKSEFMTEYRLRHEDGNYRWMFARGEAVADDLGQFSRMVGAVVDVTEKKQTEQAFCQEEQRFELVVEAANDGIWDWPDLSREEQYWSPRFKELLGYKPEELEATYSNFRDLLHPEDVATLGETLKEHYDFDKPFQVYYRLQTKFDGYHWFVAKGKMVRDKVTGAQRIVGSISDIHDQVKAQQEIRRYTEQLESSNRELEDFAHIASHDLKEPLRGISNYASFVLEDCGDKLDPESERRLNTIKTLCVRMDELISSLLHFSQVQRAHLTRSPTNMKDVVWEVLQRLQPSLEEKQVKVRLEEPLPSVECDALRVKEVIANLITNAIKYNDKPNPVIEIGCQDSANPNHPVFFVKDNGIGIAEHQQVKAFQMFRRLHAREAYGGGTGVGLAIVKKIIDQHEGTIWLESTPGEGTTFFFTLSSSEGEAQTK